MKFRKWLDGKFENEELITKFISIDNKLDELYWHKILRFSGSKDIKDGDYYITAALKEDNEYVFGLLPLYNKDFNIITVRSNDLNFLEDSVIVERDEYEDELKEIDSAIEKLQNKIKGV